jgi:murein DD-endopeptidase MepM/ murein hydrolase activator NlpD
MKFVLLSFVLIFFSSFSYALEFKGKFQQGSFILGKTQPGSKVEIDKKKIRVSKEGYFAFGLGRDRKNDVVIKVINNEKLKIIEKKVLKKEYKIQRIDGLPKKQVTPPKEVYERIKKDNVLIGIAREVDTSLNYFTKKFIKPLDKAIITGVYGSQRILNGKPRRPHYGLDYAAKEGTPIKAMMDGVVTLAEKDLYFTGGTIIFDHGHGISTLYMHMKDVDVKKGQIVKQGDFVGTVGKTGRSTGPHLDIRLNWFDVKLDPATILNLK